MTDSQVIVSVCSVVVVGLSALAALHSARSAKRSADAAERSYGFQRHLAERAEGEARPHLELRIGKESITFPTPNELTFRAVILNLSSRSNVILALYGGLGGLRQRVSLTFRAKPSEMERFQLPYVIAPYDAVTLAVTSVHVPDVKKHLAELRLGIYDMYGKHHSFAWPDISARKLPPAPPPPPDRP